MIKAHFFQGFPHQGLAEILSEVLKHQEVTMMLTTKIQNKIMFLVNTSVPLKFSLSPSSAAYHHHSVEEINQIDQKHNTHQQPKTQKNLNEICSLYRYITVGLSTFS